LVKTQWLLSDLDWTFGQNRFVGSIGWTEVFRRCCDSQTYFAVIRCYPRLQLDFWFVGLDCWSEASFRPILEVV
jgi:hypothetical protein